MILLSLLPSPLSMARVISAPGMAHAYNPYFYGEAKQLSGKGCNYDTPFETLGLSFSAEPVAAAAKPVPAQRKTSHIEDSGGKHRSHTRVPITPTMADKLSRVRPAITSFYDTFYDTCDLDLLRSGAWLVKRERYRQDGEVEGQKYSPLPTEEEGWRLRMQCRRDANGTLRWTEICGETAIVAFFCSLDEQTVSGKKPVVPGRSLLEAFQCPYLEVWTGRMCLDKLTFDVTAWSDAYAGNGAYGTCEFEVEDPDAVKQLATLVSPDEGKDLKTVPSRALVMLKVQQSLPEAFDCMVKEVGVDARAVEAAVAAARDNFEMIGDLVKYSEMMGLIRAHDEKMYEEEEEEELED